MSNSNFTPVNEFVARGIVDSIGKSQYGGKSMTLIVRERRALLKLNLALEPGVARGIGRKDRVVVKGFTKAFSYHNDALNKDSEVMFFTATEVTHDEPELAQRFGAGLGIFYPESVFRAFISGKITKIKRQEDNPWAQITVETCGGGRDLRPSYVVLRYYVGGRLPVFDYQVGDIICSRLSAYTPEKKLPNGRDHIYQNLVVEDIAYLDKQPRAEEMETPNPFDLGLRDPNSSTSKSLEAQEAQDIATANAQDDIADDSDLMGYN